MRINVKTGPGKLSWMAALVAVAGILFLFIPPLGKSGNIGKEVRAETFARLEKIRSHKKKRVIAELKRLEKKVEEADQDRLLMDLYRELYDAKGLGEFSRVEPNALDKMDLRYVDAYADFYDILFIRDDGRIFYSVKLEPDFQQNIFGGPLSGTKLARALKATPDIRFIDYDYYPPSREAASFLVKRLSLDGKNGGWIAFQLSLNALNAILTDRAAPKEWGRTGEVYLTNESKVMLTDSRFFIPEGGLRRKVETEATALALRQKEGNVVAKDYRGMRVFSSVERFSFAGSAWIIAAEIDEDEVITEMYRKNRKYFLKEIWKRLTPGREIPKPEKMLEDKFVKVDINEYSRGGPGDLLATYGVSTCTGLALSFPEKFSYLAHLYPLDGAYFSTWERPLVDFFLGMISGLPRRGGVDLLSEIIHDIKYYDVYPSEYGNLDILIAATHTKSFERIVDKFLEGGFFLSRIKILHYPGMRRANIVVDVNQGQTAVEWMNEGGKTEKWTDGAGTPDVGSLVKAISGY